MKAEKAIEHLDTHYKFLENCWKPYPDPNVLEAIKISISALGKQVAKKPIFDMNYSDTSSLYHCVCGDGIVVEHDSGTMDNNDAPRYCSKCGCKLEWRE